MTSFPAVLCAGAMLGGVLGLCGSWSRGARTGPLPHLTVGAVASVGSAVVLRFPQWPGLARVALAVVVGGLLGAVLERLEARLDPGRLPFAPDLAAMAAALSVFALIAPAAGPAESRTLLGGAWPQGAGTSGVYAAVAVLAAGAIAAVALARLPVRLVPGARRWAVAGALVAAFAAVAAAPFAGATAFGRPQPLMLALAGALAALLARGPLGAYLAGVLLSLLLAIGLWLGLPPAVGIGAPAVAAAVALRLDAAEPDAIDVADVEPR